MKSYKKIINISEYVKNRYADYTLVKIETTGLSKYTDSIVMISYLDINYSEIEVYYIENLKEEFELLETLKSKKIITFNGNKFDYAFITEKFKFYRTELLIDNHIDFHDYLKKNNFILHLTSFKQKDIEKYLGIQSNNEISGFKIAKDIESYLIKKDTSKIDDVISHSVNSLTSLANILELTKNIEEKTIINYKNTTHKINSVKFINNFLYISGETSISREIQVNNFDFSIEINNNQFNIELECKEGLYNDGEKVYYVLNEKNELKNVDNILSPSKIHLVYYKEILINNIIEVVKRIIDFSLSV